jgi:hypothetical protein
MRGIAQCKHTVLAAHWRQDPVTLATALAPGRSLAPIDGLIRT